MQALKSSINIITKLLSTVVPKKKNRWVFGSWFGKGYMDNSRYLLEYICEIDSNLELIWIQDCNKRPEQLPSNVTFVKYGTFESFCSVLTAEVIVVSQGFADVFPYALHGGSYMVQLWHGVAWKKIGKDSRKPTNNPMVRLFRKLVDWYSHGSLYIAPSKEYASKMGPALGAKAQEIVYVGQPRNQVLFEKVFIDNSKQELIKKYFPHTSNNPIVITYMPTFRDGSSKIFSLTDIVEDVRIKEIVEKKNVVFLQRNHFVSQQRECTIKENNNVARAMDVDAEVILGGSDILITDYSSCFFDYLVLNKPIIHFIYDYDFYANKDRGLYYQIDEVVAGDTPRTKDELIQAIINAVNYPDYNKELREQMRNKFCEFESKDNSKIIVDRIQRDLSK